MSKRLQVILEDDEMREIKRAAAREHTSVADWVRRAIWAARRQQPGKAAQTKIEHVRAGVRHAFPVAEIGQILREIESGYLKE